MTIQVVNQIKDFIGIILNFSYHLSYIWYMYVRYKFIVFLS